MWVHVHISLAHVIFAGRLITTTLPNDVVSVNVYDDADRLTQLSHTVSGTNQLIGQYNYVLDKVGNRLTTTETLRTPPHVISAPLTLGSVLTVTAASGHQEGVALAYNANDDEYLVVWKDARNDAGDIYGHFRDGDGAAIGSAFTVHITTTNTQNNPAIANNAADDRYLVVWQDTRASGDPEVYGRLFDGSGTAQGAEFEIAGDSVSRLTPQVVYDAASGQFMVVYKSGMNSMTARSVSITGTLGTAFAVADGYSLLEIPRVASDGEGAFLALWQYSNAGDYNILGQRFTLTTTVGSVISVTEATGRQEYPALAYDPDSGQYLAVWKDGRGVPTTDRQLYGQFVDQDGSLSGSNFRIDDVLADVYNPAVVVLAGRWLAAWRSSTDAYYRPVDAEGNLDDRVTLAAATETQALPAFAGHESAALAGWQTNEVSGTGYDISVRPISAPVTGTLETTVITYTYDDLYRLTDAAYTGTISATYAYQYDAVGNMTAYTETIGTETTTVSRVFNDWNQLQSATESGSTTNYTYDGAGNLVEVLPPGASAGQGTQYGYDQRNLLITSTTYVSGTGQTAVADYVYDGNGDRLRQVDYTGASVITTTYTNDPMGLTQVLVADDGTDQVYNVRGNGLIAQYGGADDLFLLTDGLGSVRQEVTGTLVVALTTYGPYGNVVEAAGSSLSTYGFTGEQEDGATGLLYLRARYYDPSLRTFVSRDPYSGQPRMPATMHGYSYAHNNPGVFTDPSGACILFGVDTLACVAIWGGVAVAGGAAITWAVRPPDINMPDQDWLTDYLDFCEAVIEYFKPTVEFVPAVPKPQTQASPRPDTQTVPDPEPSRPYWPIDIFWDPDRNRGPKVIVELGAGDYKNAIAIKMANFNNRVMATNSIDDWTTGKIFYEGGLSNELVDFYTGWLAAQAYGVEVGTPVPYENSDIADQSADFVYVFLPYPVEAYQFGQDAARIIKSQPGSTVAIVSGSSNRHEQFIEGFNDVRGGSVFVPFAGAFGSVNTFWEDGPYNTWIHVVS